MLGVKPNSDLAEIRAAYRTLMRRYHPDADPGGAAAGRARDINVAYSVLSNPDKRASYDESLMEHRRIRFDPPPTIPVSDRRRSRIAPIAAIGFTLVAAGMVVFAVLPAGLEPRRLKASLATQPELIAAAGETIRIRLPRSMAEPAALASDRPSEACPDDAERKVGMACGRVDARP